MNGGGGGGQAANGKYANCDENSNAEGAVGYDCRQSPENIYETICNEPAAGGVPASAIVEAGDDDENIYETIEDVRQAQQQQQINALLQQDVDEELVYNMDPDQPSCSSTYGRIGNAYGRIDVIGHGIGRIERHLSSSCGSINSNHYAIESLYGGTRDASGRISKVSVQWLLANKWLPLWIANTETGRDYRIIDFLIAQGLERDDECDEGADGEDDNAEREQQPPL